MITLEWLKHQYNRAKYFAKHRRDDYGKPGFSQLFYKGKPIMVKDDIPKNEMWFVDDTGRVIAKLNVKTGKVRKIK